ncbi:PKD domain-containing protein [Lacihabitans sp. LS3-19]|uniref:NPCBM/NEW2 domain-containing protein n=1 Tax=Lacihabitans sp. LS3-19 TaxID=2487335 RepID=UPI0020CF3715|nr:NPCBM/NEW2 domain-containing protein [Lacihabitans sp. LS3-19]MCP9769673.1 PKD domain-containing protein [Lacihabitans sp. LS3-19]
MLQKIGYFLAIFLIFTFKCFSQSPPQLPAGFIAEEISTWDAPMGTVFDGNNRMYVWERGGKVFVFHNNIKTQLLDISEETNSHPSLGLISMVLDPNFSSNGYIYLFYIVDRHYLLNYGTPSYSATTSEVGATIARVSRFTLNASNGFNSVVPNSKVILVGTTKSNGFPHTGTGHCEGDLKFGSDGSLIVTCGDGAINDDYEDQAYADQILSQEEYDARRLWRCQILNSLNGKVLRINPSNGEGYPSNPYFEPSNPSSKRSKIFARGFRNPFRITMKPGTGAHLISEGNPGAIYIGDVGQETKEEIDVITTGGQNFGWPKFEGMDHVNISNATYEPTSFQKPALEWGRTGSTARVLVNNVVKNFGSVDFPYTNFTGSCAIGGVFYEGTKYPEEFHDAYFFADFNDQWVRTLKFDNNNNPISKSNFGNSVVGLIHFSYNPHDEFLYYATVTNKVVRLKYEPNGNQNPIANFEVSKKFGASPLLVQFDASSTMDPDGDILTYNWSFGDGASATGVSPSHTFYSTVGAAPQVFEVVLTVLDGQGGVSTFSLKISTNNTPPIIHSTSVDNFAVFQNLTSQNLNLTAQVSDAQQPNNQLSTLWEVYLHHNDHEHPYFSQSGTSHNYSLSGVDCEHDFYFYELIFTVTDSYGLTTRMVKNIFPNCATTDFSPPSFANLKVENFSQNSFKLKWNSLTDNDQVKKIEIRINGISNKFIAGNSTEFTYSSDQILTGKTFVAQVIPRDNAGNATPSSELIFQVPVCQGSIGQEYISNIVPLSSSNGYGPLELDKSNGEGYANDGHPITLNGVVYPKGIGVHANAEIQYNLSGTTWETFHASIGLDDEVNGIGCGSVTFSVYKDNVLAYQSPTFYDSTPTVQIDIPIKNTNILKLVVDGAGNGLCGDHGDWADAKFLSNCTFTDILAPSTLLSLSKTNNNTDFQISWNASSDNIDNSVAYEIYLNGVLFQTINSTVIYIPIANEGKTLTIQAVDDIGNKSVCQTMVLNTCPAALILSAANNISNQIDLIKQSSGYLIGFNSITNQSKVQYQAANYLEFLPGFYVENGSIFKAQISGCN